MKKGKWLLVCLLMIAVGMLGCSGSSSSEEAKDETIVEKQKEVVEETAITEVGIPKSSIECEEMNYQDVIDLFTDAGFVDVSAVGMEVEATDEVEGW